MLQTVLKQLDYKKLKRAKGIGVGCPFAKYYGGPRTDAMGRRGDKRCKELCDILFPELQNYYPEEYCPCHKLSETEVKKTFWKALKKAQKRWIWRGDMMETNLTRVMETVVAVCAVFFIFYLLYHLCGFGG